MQAVNDRILSSPFGVAEEKQKAICAAPHPTLLALLTVTFGSDVGS